MLCKISICPRDKMSDFALFPLFGFNLVIKLRNFDFESIEIVQYFQIKEMMPDLNTSCQTVSDLVSVVVWAQLSSLLVIKWEIQILNFIAIVYQKNGIKKIVSN